MKQNKQTARVLEGPFPPALDAALDRTCVFDELTSLVRSRYGEEARVLNLEIEHLQRRVARYTMAIQTKAGKEVSWRVIGKVYQTGDRAKSSYQTARQIWKHGFSSAAADRIKIAEPLDVIHKCAMVLLEEIPGEPLRHRVKRMEAHAADLRLFASAVVKLHRCPIDAGAPYTIADRLARGFRPPTPLAIGEHYPELTSPIEYVLQTAAGIGQQLGNDIYTFVHGDLHLGQVHIHDGQAWIIDLDEVRCADPAYDLAEIYVFLKRTARKKRRTEYIRAMRTAFLDGYFSQLDRRIALRVPLYEGLMHLTRACKCLRVQDEDDWQDQMIRLVHQSVSCLQAMQSTADRFQGREPPPAAVVDLYDSCPGEY